jgi:hypothetical protein
MKRTLATLVMLSLLGACRPALESERPSGSPDVIAAIRENGEAAVMIALVEPAGYSDPAQAAQARAEIARMQTAVRAVLDTVDYRHGQSFAAIPAMSGVIRTERGLRMLLAHPFVRRVDRDAGGAGTGSSTGD